MPIRSVVGRTNSIILVLGVFGCVVLSLMMRQALEMKQEYELPPVVIELSHAFGPRLVDESKFRVVRSEGSRIAVTSIKPLLGVNVRRLCRDVGRHVWMHYREEPPDAVVVDADDGVSGPQRYLVPDPLQPGRVFRAIDAEVAVNAELVRLKEQPEPKSGKKAVPKTPSKAPAGPKDPGATPEATEPKPAQPPVKR